MHHQEAKSHSSPYVAISALLAFFSLVLYTLHPGIVKAATTDTLNVGQFLTSGQSLVSQSGNYRLTLQLDGNLVEYNSSGKAIWYTGILDPTANKLILQDDSNLVLYNAANSSVWSSRFLFADPSKLVVQNDGNITMYNSSQMPGWDKSDAS